MKVEEVEYSLFWKPVTPCTHSESHLDSREIRYYRDTILPERRNRTKETYYANWQMWRLFIRTVNMETAMLDVIFKPRWHTPDHT